MRVACCALDGRSGHAAGRELLETLWKQESGEPLPEIRITPWGKPYFVNSDYHFSISHTRRHAFCALGRCPVGIDAEELGRKISPVFANRVLSPEEKERVSSAADPDRAFLSLWVLKEAAVKLSGTGLRGFPNKTDFSPDDPRVWEWDGCLVALLWNEPQEGVTYHAF